MNGNVVEETAPRCLVKIPPLPPPSSRTMEESPECQQFSSNSERKRPIYPDQRDTPHHATKKPKKSTNIEQYKNPMEYFNHIFAGALPAFSFSDESDPTTKMPNFKATINVNGRTYSGSGTSKKDAKQVCAYDYINQNQGKGLADRLLYLYENQEAVVFTTQSQTRMQTGHWMSPQKHEVVKYDFLPNESRSGYLQRVFGPKAIYSEPLVKRTRHGPITMVTLYIYGIPGDGMFQGEGPGEQEAQDHAAALALLFLKRYPSLIAQLQETVNASKSEENFWADSQDLDWTYSSNAKDDFGLMPGRFERAEMTVTVGGPAMMPAAINKDKMNKKFIEKRLKQPNVTPLTVIHEIGAQALQYEFVEERGEKHRREYVLKAVFCGREYVVSARSKKEAKMNAACQILKEEFGVVVASEAANPAVLGDEVPNGDRITENHTAFADQLQKLVKDTFYQLNMNNIYTKYKVLAGIAMTRNEAWDDFQIICVTTGTKTLNGEHISTGGSVIHDCHAEILAKRCLRRFLYSELLKSVKSFGAEHTNEQDKSIFELVPLSDDNHKPQPEEDTSGFNGFRLKKGIRFHLYINTTPCGDARIFSPHEVSSGTDSTPSRKNRGLLRVKIEAGEGTIPSTNEDLGVQTFDGILAGKRLLNMSCSDKVLRMNVMGLQGGLLSWFIEPIYLSSVVIGSFYHADHLQRAVVTRFKDLEENSCLVTPFRTAQPLLCSVAFHEARLPSKAPGYAINWTCIDGSEVEIIDCAKGKTAEAGENSRVCKKAFFGLFRDLQKAMPCMRDVAYCQQEKAPITYRDCKRQAADYKQSKAVFIKALEKSECGKWLGKPQEVDTFF